MLQAHFKTEAKTTDIFIPTKKSTWTPPNPHHTVKTFINAIENDLKETPRSCKNRNNLSKGELDSLDKLKTRDDIIITRADKGGAVVIIDVEDYIKEANRQLENSTFYDKLPVGTVGTVGHENIRRYY